MAYDGRHIPIVCEGWNRIEKLYYKELETTEGKLLTTTLTYKLKGHDNSLRY
jgi:hypothetical protein